MTMVDIGIRVYVQVNVVDLFPTKSRRSSRSEAFSELFKEIESWQQLYGRLYPRKLRLRYEMRQRVGIWCLWGSLW